MDLTDRPRPAFHPAISQKTEEVHARQQKVGSRRNRCHGQVVADACKTDVRIRSCRCSVEDRSPLCRGERACRFRLHLTSVGSPRRGRGQGGGGGEGGGGGNRQDGFYSSLCFPGSQICEFLQRKCSKPTRLGQAQIRLAAF